METGYSFTIFCIYDKVQGSYLTKDLTPISFDKCYKYASKRMPICTLSQRCNFGGHNREDFEVHSFGVVVKEVNALDK